MGRPKGSRNAVGQNAAGTRLPRRYKTRGKEGGNYFQRVGDKDVNLRTKDARIALLRAKEAKAGKTFTKDDQSDGDAAATSIAATVVGKEAAKAAPFVEPPAPAASGVSPGGSPPGFPQGVDPTHTRPAALPPIGASPNGQTPPTREGVKPDGYFPPAPGWAEQVAQAAAAGGAREEEEDADEEMDPEMLEGLFEQAAELAVELQLMLQAWILKKRLEAKAGEVPAEGPGSKGRVIGAKLWKKELRRMVPDDWGLPGWVVAPLMIAAYTLPVQLGGATPIPKDGAEPAPPAAPDGVTP
jgi:hypothetical protein